MTWKLTVNSDGDCLYEFQDPNWVVVHGCDVWTSGACDCEPKPGYPPSVELPVLSEIIRKPCVSSSFPTDAAGVDAYGFLYPIQKGKIHCIRAHASGGWVHYYYDDGSTTEPPKPLGGFDGLLDCTDLNGNRLALGLLVDFGQKAELYEFMAKLSKTLEDQASQMITQA